MCLSRNGVATFRVSNGGSARRCRVSPGRLLMKHVLPIVCVIRIAVVEPGSGQWAGGGRGSTTSGLTSGFGRGFDDWWAQHPGGGVELWGLGLDPPGDSFHRERCTRIYHLFLRLVMVGKFAHVEGL